MYQKVLLLPIGKKPILLQLSKRGKHYDLGVFYRPRENYPVYKYWTYIYFFGKNDY